jgi:hypothetical protein
MFDALFMLFQRSWGLKNSIARLASETGILISLRGDGVALACQGAQVGAIQAKYYYRDVRWSGVDGNG